LIFQRTFEDYFTYHLAKKHITDALKMTLDPGKGSGPFKPVRNTYKEEK